MFEANLANPGPLGKFYKVDLSSMREVERFTDEVMKDTKGKGIDYLVLCAGGPPVGSWRGPTYEVPSPDQLTPFLQPGFRECFTWIRFNGRGWRNRLQCSVFLGM